MTQSHAPIVTFYSFKGGVGRSMALANVAFLLARKYGRRVLVVDWDLEAPGLHRFFDIPQQRVGAGLIDLLNDYKNLLRKEVKTLPSSLIEIKKYIDTIPVGNGSSDGVCALLPAGRQDDSYAKLVNEFNWEEFYATWHGFAFMEYLKEQLKSKADADIVLIDSRTGITDIGGICTMQLPDVVVMLFALNEQNIDGVHKIIKGILATSTEATERKEPPKLILRPARVERYLEQDRKRKWEQLAADRLGEYLPPADQKNAVRFMKKKSIPYIGAFGFGEVPLAADVDPDAELTEAFEDLAYSILKEAGIWTAEDARIRGVREEEVSSTEDRVEVPASLLETVRETVSFVSRTVFSPPGLFISVAIALTFFAIILWPKANLDYLLFRVSILSQPKWLFFVGFCGGIGCCWRFIALRILHGAWPRSGSMKFLASVALGAITAVVVYASGKEIINPQLISNPVIVASVAFFTGFSALQVLDNVTTVLLPRNKS